METLEFADKSFNILQKYTHELLSIEEPKSKLKYTAKLVHNLSEPRKKLLNTEIKILQNLQFTHPCLLSLHSFTFLDTSCLILYEYCSNGPLSSIVPVNPLKILHFLCMGVSFLHGKSLLHNDLTVFNVFLGPVPKILGLELVTEEELLMDVSSSANQDYTQGPMAQWRAPEHNEGFSPSKKSDIWGLGQIFFFLLTQQVFTGAIPENISAQCKDIILMTLNKNPYNRASIQAVIKKIEERQIVSPRVIHGCGCFPARRFFSCGHSTPTLVRKIINSEMEQADKHLKRLIKKVWDTPGKIAKFYNEILQLQDLSNNEIRLKTCILLFIYLQKAPISAFSTTPGVLEVLNFIESKLRPANMFQENESMLRNAHTMNLIIKSKYYVVKSHLMNFNGVFASVSSSIKKFFQEPQILVCTDLLDYWDKLLSFQEHLLLIAFNNDLLRFVRKVLAEEQNHLLELVKTLIQVSPETFESLGITQKFVYHIERAKSVFKIDCLHLNSPDSEQEILVSAEYHSLPQVSLRSAKKSPASNNVRFTPVKLDDDEAKEPIKPQSFQISHSKESEVYNSDPVDYEEQLQRISEAFQNWNISSKDLTLLKTVGKGGSCEVWLGLYQKTQVAIKRQISRQHKSLKEFEREVQFLVNTRHPNLLTFMGICLEEPLSIVTEFCGGGTLFNLLHNRKDTFVSWTQKLVILKEISKGMLFLHARNFIHRDLKSLNVLLSSEINKPNDAIQLKISDFGLTREVNLEELMTGKIGTSHWMAPEVLSSSKYSTRADVYSFAIVMYEVLTREIPYKGKKQEEIRTQVMLNTLRPDLRHIPPSCPAKLLTLMTMCWKEDAEKRPSFSSILDLLNSISVPNN